MRTLFSLAYGIFISSAAIAQGWQPPQLPQAPQPAIIQPVAMPGNIPSPSIPVSNTNTAFSARPVSGNMSNIPKGQQPDPLRPSDADRRRLDQDKREAMQDAVEAIDKRPYRRTVQDADLDTMFGNPPVLDQSTYQATKPFWDALVVLTDMANGQRKFSLTEAIYTVENAYFKNGLNKSQFLSAIQSRVDLAKQIMLREKLDPASNLAKNYAIQKQFEQPNKYTIPNSEKIITVPKLEYDFTDFMGDSSHAQMFVSKLIATGKGQCHSLPLLYLAVAEQLNAQAYLSLAPEHSFVRFSDGDGSLYNFETTTGAIVSDNWMVQSGYITTAAIKNKIFLDTLSQRQLLALCINDLAIGYIYDNGFDGFAETALKYSIPLDPGGIQGKIILSNFWAAKTRKAIQYLNLATKEQFEQSPIAKAMQRNMLQTYDVIDGLGYQKMPKEAYAAWLQSVNEQKEKQDQQQLQQRFEYLMKKNKVNLDHPLK
jgi:hypothetical protein